MFHEMLQWQNITAIRGSIQTHVNNCLGANPALISCNFRWERTVLVWWIYGRRFASYVRMSSVSALLRSIISRHTGGQEKKKLLNEPNYLMQKYFHTFLVKAQIKETTGILKRD